MTNDAPMLAPALASDFDVYGRLEKFAAICARSARDGLVPKAFRNADGTVREADVFLAALLGHELGLEPMQSLQNIAVINGRPSVWGDAMLAICVARADFVDIREEVTSERATCTVKRRGRSDVVRTFTMEDAKRARLTEKDGPWKQYPARMLQMRARAFALRDAFPDALRGVMSADEARDLPPAAEVDISDRVEVVQRPAETRADAVARALAPPAPAVRPAAATVASPEPSAPPAPAGEAVDPVAAFVDAVADSPEPEAPPAPEPPAGPPLPTPPVVKATKAAIDRADSVDAVNVVLDSIREWPAGDGKKNVQRWARQRIGELTGNAGGADRG